MTGKGFATFALLSLAYSGSFVIEPSPAQAASYRVIYRFTGNPDGVQPLASLISDSEGRLYGTTTFGGALGIGIAYRLTKPALMSGAWTEEILHSFSVADGGFLYSPLLRGSSGELYGTAAGYGAFERGTVYRFGLGVPRWPRGRCKPGEFMVPKRWGNAQGEASGDRAAKAET